MILPNPWPRPELLVAMTVEDVLRDEGCAIVGPIGRVEPAPPRSPWQNAYVERLIGSIRRECLDHLVIFNEAHLHRALSAYATYYSAIRTHLALRKDAPLGRWTQRAGTIKRVPHVGGLHHAFVRI